MISPRSTESGLCRSTVTRWSFRVSGSVRRRGTTSPRTQSNALRLDTVSRRKDPGPELSTTHAGPNTVSLAKGEAYVSNLDASIEHACSKAIHAARSVGEGRSGEWNLFAMSTWCQRDHLARIRRLAGTREAGRFICVVGLVIWPGSAGALGRQTRTACTGDCRRKGGGGGGGGGGKRRRTEPRNVPADPDPLHAHLQITLLS